MNFFKAILMPITAPIRFIQRNFKATLLVILLFTLYFNNNKTTLHSTNLQQIVLKGTITNVDNVLEQIEEAKNNTNIKGVLFVVNSGGGAVAPSIEIAYAIKELNALKPVVAYASGTMASGSYYASIWAKKILANPGSLIGSIGVIMQSADASDLLQTIGIRPQTVKIGKYKEAGTPTRAWTKEEKAELNKVIKSTYNMFVNDVASARKLKVKNHKIFADAHIFTSSQAKQVGLIDDIVTINKAKKILIKEAKVKIAVWSKKDKIQKIMDKLITSTISQISMLTNLKLMAN
jgi:protease-4